MTAEESHRPVYCLIIGKNETLHLRDEVRPKPGANWSICSWPPSGEDRSVPLAVARTKYATYTPCDECFPGRVLPADEG